MQPSEQITSESECRIQQTFPLRLRKQFAIQENEIDKRIRNRDQIKPYKEY